MNFAIVILFIGVIAFAFGVLILWLMRRMGAKFGVLKGKKIYSDTQEKPGEILYAKSCNLVGKPDYLIVEGSMIYPVEYKSGRTPVTPYLNHTMQLMAYCFLVEENFGVRPTGGYLKYPEREFKIAYNDEARDAVRNLVLEMSELKRNGKELHCNHKEHNF